MGMLVGMSDVVYGLVRELLRYGPPASRNAAFEAYQDPRFSRAVRIYQFLASLRRDLEELMARGVPIALSVVNEGERLALSISYDKEQLHRTAYLRREEWELLRDDPTIGGLLAHFELRG